MIVKLPVFLAYLFMLLLLNMRVINLPTVIEGGEGPLTLWKGILCIQSDNCKKIWLHSVAGVGFNLFINAIKTCVLSLCIVLILVLVQTSIFYEQHIKFFPEKKNQKLIVLFSLFSPVNACWAGKMDLDGWTDHFWNWCKWIHQIWTFCQSLERKGTTWSH